MRLSFTHRYNKKVGFLRYKIIIVYLCGKTFTTAREKKKRRQPTQ